ncbi:MAG: aspartate aminotransferase, partial [Candidatus Neomarinimicrobiota bacterium]
LASVMDKVDKDAKSILDRLKVRRDICVKLLNSIKGLSLITPDSTFYLYLNVRELMDNKNIIDLEKFRINALKNTGVAFCTRNHFGSLNAGQDENYIRLAYSGINSEAIKEGLISFKNWIEN